jgi:tetratricopeptide (TPR) repeat protein
MATNEGPDERELWSSLPHLEGIERAQAYYQLSGIAFENGQYTKSLTLAEEAKDTFHNVPDDFGYALSVATVAFCLKSLDRVQDALSEMMKAVLLFAKLGTKEEWEYRHHLATWLKESDDYESAMGQYKLCLENCSYEGDYFGAACDQVNIGLIECELTKCLDAIENFKQARVVFKKNKDLKRVADMDLFIACCYNHLKDGVSAEAYAIKAVSVFDSLCLRDKRAQSYSQLGRAKNHQGEFQEALVNFENAQELVVDCKDVNFYAVYQIQRGKATALRGLGMIKEAEQLEARNAVINETLEWDRAEIES